MKHYADMIICVRELTPFTTFMRFIRGYQFIPRENKQIFSDFNYVKFGLCFALKVLR